MSTEQCNGFWVGIDVAKDSFEAALAGAQMRPAQWAQLKVHSYVHNARGVEQLIKRIGRHGGRCQGVCMESTGIYSKQLARLLNAAGLAVSIVNPARPLAFRRSIGVRDKSDRVDAAVLAMYGVAHRPQPTPQPRACQQRLQVLWRLREDLLQQCRPMQQRLKQAEDRFVRRELKLCVMQLSRALGRVETEIEQVVATDDQLRHDARLIQTIPGVGRLTAWLVLAELGDLRDWKRNELVGYAGVFPREYSSGVSVQRRPTMAKAGGGRLRRGLFILALGMQTRPGVLRDYTRRLIDAGKAKMCAMGALMRKLLLVIRAVVLSGKPFDPALIGAGG